jgi:hypothetical protein
MERVMARKRRGWRVRSPLARERCVHIQIVTPRSPCARTQLMDSEARVGEEDRLGRSMLKRIGVGRFE